MGRPSASGIASDSHPLFRIGRGFVFRARRKGPRERSCVLIGAVADDMTGATDLCLTLARAGLRTVQLVGVPATGQAIPAADAVVIALKSRTIAAPLAVAQSLAALRLLQGAGAEQIVFKYCSTFDSTDAGNIGPVTEALMGAMETPFTIACPAFPENGRTVYNGHLFVGDTLLSDSPMKDHPLTPMRDANLVRVLARQTGKRVGLVPLRVVLRGADALRAAFAAAGAEGVAIAIVDAISDHDLTAIGEACRDMPLVTGGSAIAQGLAANFVRAGRLVPAVRPGRMTAPPGRAAILAGSCSAATLRQIAVAEAAGLPVFGIDVADLASGRQTADRIVDWAVAQGDDTIPLIRSSAPPEALAGTQAAFGREAAGALVEQVLSEVAQGLVGRGFSRLVVAGGETSGAVVAALGVTALTIGPEIDPGVPWTRSLPAPDLALALKSGNFGAPDFFLKAWTLLDDTATQPSGDAT